MSRPRSNSREVALIAAALLVGCLVGPLLGFRGLAAARADLDRAASTHAQTLVAARRIEALAQRQAVFADQPRPEPDLVARIGAQMATVGLDPAQLSRVGVSASEPIGDGELRRQTATLSLSLDTPADAARWLAAWRNAEPAWTAASIRIDRAARGGERPYTVAISLESLHRPDAADPDPPSPAELLKEKRP